MSAPIGQDALRRSGSQDGRSYSRSRLMSSKNAFLLVVGFLIALPASARDSLPRITVVDETLVSTVLRDNRIGLDPARAIKVLLPAGYAKSGQRYPVVYFLHNAWYGPTRMIEDGRAQRLIERAFANRAVSEFIFVVADYTGPTTGSSADSDARRSSGPSTRRSRRTSRRRPATASCIRR
jgi:hypothetical protein